MVSSAEVTDRGFKYDRRWILVDRNNKFITQRQFPQMSLLQVLVEEHGLRVFLLGELTRQIVVPFEIGEKEVEKVTIWNAVCDAINVSGELDHWFSNVLNKDCKLMYMPDETMRPVDTTSGYAPKGKFTSFADAYPFLLMGEASLNDLNSRLQEPVLINRFRPNIVFVGGYPYQEDVIDDFVINGVKFTGLENCSRCAIVNINQENAVKEKEPLKTLATYRRNINGIPFARNVVHTGTGIVNVGDEIFLV